MKLELNEHELDYLTRIVEEHCGEFFEDDTTAQYGTNGFDLDYNYGGGLERSGENEYTITAAGTLQRTAATIIEMQKTAVI